MEIKIANGRFKITKKIGHGAFGELYSAFDIQDRKEVAVKLESVHSTSPPQLSYEAKIYKYLQGGRNFITSVGIPTIYYYGCEGEYNTLVIDLLGESLEGLFSYCRRKFTIKTVLMLAEQCV